MTFYKLLQSYMKRKVVDMGQNILPSIVGKKPKESKNLTKIPKPHYILYIYAIYWQYSHEKKKQLIQLNGKFPTILTI